MNAEWLSELERLEWETLHRMQGQRASGGNPVQWLIPEELRQAAMDDSLVHNLFELAISRVRTSAAPAADFASREPVLIRLVLLLVQDRAELLKQLHKLHAEGIPDVVLNGVRYVHTGSRR